MVKSEGRKEKGERCALLPSLFALQLIAAQSKSHTNKEEL